jgi:uncharacterized protein (DUF58 family)
VSVAPAAAELARAARLLTLRSRREATSVLGGAYTSAFRGGGVEFEELRPYVPGDDVRALDWNATARTGTPFVRRFREDRDQTLLLLLDVSASMHFGAAGRSKAALAAHLAALLATAAGRAGDRIGLLAFDDAVRDELPPDRGPAHAFRVVRRAVSAAGRAGGATGLSAALARLPGHARLPAIVCLISDFRDPQLGEASTRSLLAAAAARHDLVSLVLHDPREDELPDAGPVRFSDPEDPRRTTILDSGDPRVRARYRAAAAARRRGLVRRLRSVGSDVLWMRTNEEPLRALARFFRQRIGRRLLLR